MEEGWTESSLELETSNAKKTGRQTFSMKTISDLKLLFNRRRTTRIEAQAASLYFQKHWQIVIFLSKTQQFRQFMNLPRPLTFKKRN